MTKKWYLLALSLTVILFLLTGCPANQEPPADERQPSAQNGQQQQAADLDITALTEQWAESSHTNVVLSPAGRDNCVICHDGGAFAAKITMIDELEREFPVSTDCRACHTGQGAELIQSGTVSIATQENVQSGTGALCMACHHERSTPDPENTPAPHASSQAGVFTGTGGARVEGFNYGNSPHASIQNSCVGCHMTDTQGGFASHSFRVDDPAAACGNCHGNMDNVNMQAKNDYDGDGNTQGFQDEVQGLLSLVEEAIAEATNGATVSSSHGKVIFLDKGENEVEVTDEAVYKAGYNYLLVSNDGSLGIHNPIFVVQLLQQSYRELTGQDVPNAHMR